MPAATQDRVVQFSGHFSSIEELEAVTGGWSLDFCQLDKGRLAAELQQVGTGRAVLSRIRFSRALDQRGCPPPGLLTFGFLESKGPGVRWCSRDADDLTLLNFNGSGGFESVSQPGHHGYTFSIAADQLAGLAGLLGARQVENCLGRLRKATRFRAAEVATLRSVARRVCDAARRDPSRLEESASFRERLELELTSRVVSVIANSEAVPDPYRSRRRAIDKACAFIDDCIGTQISVRQICGHAGVSWRTLDYAFQEQFGMTPQAYIRAIRLDQARRHLRAAMFPTIADCANHSGYWHMGKFAADYRAQFGELPSATLHGARRSKSRVGGNPRPAD